MRVRVSFSECIVVLSSAGATPRFLSGGVGRKGLCPTAWQTSDQCAVHGRNGEDLRPWSYRVCSGDDWVVTNDEHGHNHAILDDLDGQHRALRRMIPEVYEGFAHMSSAALAPGALDAKVKELLAMAIGVVWGCDGCIASHARGAVRLGATKEEAAEAIAVAILMHGGPATIHGARAYAAFVEFVNAVSG